MDIGLGLGLSKNKIISASNDPSSIPDLVGWWNFNKENLAKNVEGTDPVTADDDYIGWIRNLANGDANGDRLGEFLRCRANSTPAGGESIWKGKYKEGGANGHPYLDLPTTTAYTGYAAGVFGNLDAGEDVTNWGGISSTILTNLEMGSQQMTTFAIVQAGTSDDSQYHILGLNAHSTVGALDQTMGVARISNETYQATYIGIGNADPVEQVTSGTYADTNLHYVRTVAKAGTNACNIKIDGTIGATTDTMDYNYDFDFGQAISNTAVYIGFNCDVTNLSDSSWGESFWEGKIYEVLIFARALEDTEIADVETYLSNKYGVTV